MFGEGFEKVAAVNWKAVGNSVKKALPNSGKSAAWMGASAASGAIGGALERDETGQRGGKNGAIKGALKGAALMGAVNVVGRNYLANNAKKARLLGKAGRESAKRGLSSLRHMGIVNDK